MEAGKTDNDRKCKRSVWLSESGGNNPKSVRWNDEIKASVMRKEAA